MRLFNSLTREVEEVRPVESGHVKMYACGPTVYRSAHLGNFRTYMLGDLIRRVLEFEGFRVTLVQNITDVGHMTDESSPDAVDKMALAVEDEGLQPLEIAAKYTMAVLDDAEALGLRLPDEMPKATDHIPEMMDLTQTLIERGNAYVVDDGSVYYDVQSFPGYGKLSGNTLDKLQPGHRDLESDPRKRHHADFALWKAAGSGRLMKWPSPWGEGFPGWHIECSAMSMRYLGDRFDIHTGGSDLRFPHHEDEIAQSDGAVGHQVISIWVHGGHLRQSGQKIAKSTGNVVRVDELRERGLDPLSFRWLTFQTRYRSEMDFTWDAMTDADRRVKQLRRHMAAWAPGTDDLGEAAKGYDARFRETIAGDLDLPAAVRVVNELDHTADVPPDEKYTLMVSWDHVLGLDLEREATAGWQPTEDVQQLVAARDAARAGKDFATSDRIRDELQAMGLEVMDTPDGTKVRPRD
jgi:cysteinyl-tRNA synthetase